MGVSLRDFQNSNIYLMVNADVVAGGAREVVRRGRQGRHAGRDLRQQLPVHNPAAARLL